jgi:hypothetical protein
VGERRGRGGKRKNGGSAGCSEKPEHEPPIFPREWKCTPTIIGHCRAYCGCYMVSAYCSRVKINARSRKPHMCAERDALGNSGDQLGNGDLHGAADHLGQVA